MRVNLTKKRKLFFFQIKFIAFSVFFIFIFFSIKNNSFAQSFSSTSSEQKINEVIEFQFKDFEAHDSKKIKIFFNPKNNFKIYEDKLEFYVLSENKLPYKLEHTSKYNATRYFDPFFKTDKNVFDTPNEFTLINNQHFSLNDTIEIQLQSCSQDLCYPPTTFSLSLIPNHFAKESGGNSIEFEKPLQTQEFNTDTQEDQNPPVIEEELSLKIQSAINEKSLFVFPILLFAGLLMNLTPCVYPMIPITINVMAKYGQSKHASSKSKFLPFYYVGGMVLAYSCLGVVAGMTGSVFGSHLASTWFNVVIAILMLLLGFSMLGAIQMTKLQSIAHKIPLAENHPKIAVATMGAVSGLISAPCTGPVLSFILVLIAQNQDPLLGFTYMLFFSMGFGIPYLFLGYFGQRAFKMPKVPKLVLFTKYFFACLMFALSLYYLKGILQDIPVFKVLYQAPSIMGVLFFILLTFSSLLLLMQKKVFKILSQIAIVFSLTLLSLWLSLAATSSFSLKNEFVNIPTYTLKLHWIKDLKKAQKIAKEQDKPLLIDFWAEWCAACLKMEATTFQNKKLIQHLNSNYVLAQLDATHTPTDVMKFMERWQLQGLPAIVIFRSQSDFDEEPALKIKRFIEADELLKLTKKVLDNTSSQQ